MITAARQESAPYRQGIALSIDYIVSSLPTLSFGQPAPMTWEKFVEIVGAEDSCPLLKKGGLASSDRSGRDSASPNAEWKDLETQLKNAIAEARGGEKYKRAAEGCSLYWKNRVLACFQEKDPLKREDALDRVWWDAAGELTSPTAPLGKGALATYAVRLKIALKRSVISREAGNAAFDRLTASTRRQF